MKRLGLLMLILQLAVLQGAAAGSRFALIRFEDILSELAAYKSANETMLVELSKIPENTRNVQLQKALKELDGLLTELKNSPAGQTKTKEKLARKASSLQQEAESLRVDYAEFEAREMKRIKRRMLDSLIVLQGQIRQAAVTIVEERGFDCLFEIKGNSNTSMPVLIYAKTPIDITGDVLAALKAAEPPAADPKTPE